MNLAPTLAILAFFCLLWAIITLYSTLLEESACALPPIVPAALLNLAMLFATAAIFLHTNPHILQ